MTENNHDFNTIQFLTSLSKNTSSPILKRYLNNNVQRHALNCDSRLAKTYQMGISFCPKCGSEWTSDVFRVRTVPTPKLNKTLKKLISKQQTKGFKLSLKEKKRILAFKKSTNKLIYTCFVCQKKTVIKGTKTPKLDQSINSSIVSNHYFNADSSNNATPKNPKPTSSIKKISAICIQTPSPSSSSASKSFLSTPGSSGNKSRKRKCSLLKSVLADKKNKRMKPGEELFDILNKKS